MSNNRVGNVIHIDSAGLVTDERNVKVICILLTSAAAGDAVVIRESASGADKMTIKNGVANSTYAVPLESGPLVFANGIYIQSITSGAKVMLITSQAGA